MIGGAQINSNKKRSVHIAAEWLGYRKHTLRSVRNAYKSERTAFYNIWTRLKRTLAATATAKQQHKQWKSGSHLLYYMCLRLVYYYFPERSQIHTCTHTQSHILTVCACCLCCCYVVTEPGHTQQQEQQQEQQQMNTSFGCGYFLCVYTHVVCATQHFRFPITHSLTHSLSLVRWFVRSHKASIIIFHRHFPMVSYKL